MNNQESVVELEAPEKVPPYVLMSVTNFTRVLLTGAVVGVILIILHLVLERFIFTPLLCRENLTASVCTNAVPYGWYFAMIIGAIVGLFALARQLVFRPLLVVLAVTVSLWGIWNSINNLPWYMEVLVAAIITALTYGLFTWIARLRTFWLSAGLTLVAIILIRLVISS